MRNQRSFLSSFSKKGHLLCLTKTLDQLHLEKERAELRLAQEQRRLTDEFLDGKVNMKKLSEEYGTLERTHAETYTRNKTVRKLYSDFRVSNRRLILSAVFIIVQRNKHSKIDPKHDAKKDVER